MIKINIDENKWNEIVKGHWEWFEKHLKTKFRQILAGNSPFKL